MKGEKPRSLWWLAFHGLAPVSSLVSLPTSVLHAHSVPITSGSLLLQWHVRHTTASRPLHLLFFLFGYPSPRYLPAYLPPLPQIFLKCHLPWPPYLKCQLSCSVPFIPTVFLSPFCFFSIAPSNTYVITYLLFYYCPCHPTLRELSVFFAISQYPKQCLEDNRYSVNIWLIHKLMSEIKICFVLFFKFIYLFWLCWVFVAARGLSLVAASRGYSSLRCTGFSLQWLLLLWSTGSRHVGSVVVAHRL